MTWARGEVGFHWAEMEMGGPTSMQLPLSEGRSMQSQSEQGEAAADETG